MNQSCCLRCWEALCTAAMNASRLQWTGWLNAISHAPCSQATETCLHAISMHGCPHICKKHYNCSSRLCTCNLIHTQWQNRAHHGSVYANVFSHAHPQAGACSGTDLAGSEDGLQDGVVLLRLQLLLLSQVAFKRAQLLAQHGPIVCRRLRSVGGLLLRHHGWPHQRQHCHVLALPLCIQPATPQGRRRTEHIGSSNLHTESRRQCW